MSELMKVAGLWINTDKNGEKYMAGNIDPTKLPPGHFKVMIMKNKYKKEGEKTPDYVLFAAAAEKKNETPKQEEVPF